MKRCLCCILLIGIWLIVKNVIDWRIPVFYLGTIAVISMIIAIATGIESWHGVPGFIWYPLLHLLTGGVIFGGVFSADRSGNDADRSIRTHFLCDVLQRPLPF